MKRRLRIISRVVPIILLLTVVGCGGGGGGGGDSDDPVDDQTSDPVNDQTGDPVDDQTGGSGDPTTVTDSDQDGQLDGQELQCGSDPDDAASLSTDTDSDGTPDCVDPVNDDLATGSDTDGDGQSDADEISCSSDPNSVLSSSADADGDGTPDCVEASVSNPNDTDGDLQLDADELACGSDPDDALSVSADTNGDNHPDCLRGYPVLPITGQPGEEVDCKATIPCTWVNADNSIRIKINYADSRDSSINENEASYQYDNLSLIYEVSSDIDTDLTFLDSASFSDTDFGVSDFYSQQFLSLSRSRTYSTEVVSLLAGTTLRVETLFDDGAKGQGDIDTITLPFLLNALRFEAEFKNVYHGRVSSKDKDCQNVLPCTWISPDGTSKVTVTSMGLTNVADLKGELAVETTRDGVTLTMYTYSRGRGSDLSTFTGYSQRFDQVNDLSRSLVNAILEPNESRAATLVFGESPSSSLKQLARLNIDIFETIPTSPNYEEYSRNWEYYRTIPTPRLDPVFRNIPITQ